MPYHQHILDIPSVVASHTLQSLIQQYDAGEITTEDDLVNAIVSAYTGIVSDASEPTLTPCTDAYGKYTFREILTRPMGQLDNDLSTCYSQIQRLAQALVSLANQQTTDRLGLSDLLKSVKSKVSSLSSSSAGIAISENFTTTENIDTTQTTASINTSTGVVTLGITQDTSLNSMLSSINVDYPDRKAVYVKGIPGNNLEIQKTAQSSSVNISSDINLNNSLTNVVFINSLQSSTASVASLIDNSASTWFELESYYIPSVQPLRKQGDSYIYTTDGSGKDMAVFGSQNSATLDKGWTRAITWPGESSATNHWIVTPYSGISAPGTECALPMTLTFTFDSPVPLSWLELVPMLDKSGTCNLTSVQVSRDGSTNWVELLDKNGIILNSELSQANLSSNITVKDSKGTAVVPCTMDNILAVKVQMVQNNPVETLVGHQYQIGDVNLSLASTSWKRRARKGLFKGGYWQQQDTVTTTATASGSRLDSVGDIGSVVSTTNEQAGKTKTEVITTINSIENLQTAYDVFKAYRYSVAIRDMTFHARSYSQSSVVMFKPFRFAREIDSVVLYAAQIIPESWASSTDYIVYETSPDAVTWTTIVPSNCSNSTSKSVTFNDPTTTVYLRATLTRPSENTSESPIIDYIALTGLLHTEVNF